MIINLEQNSEEWKTWRNNSVGASDSGKLMGSLPFRFGTVTDLWKDKKGLSKDFVYNDAVLHGMASEEEARLFYEKVTGNKITPKCFQLDSYSFITASLDGVTDDLSLNVEIKTPQESSWRYAEKGEIKSYYYSQIQHQMLVTGAKLCHYWVYNVTKGGLLFEVPLNELYVEEILKRTEKFWNEFVLKNECPVPADFGMNDLLSEDHFSDEMNYKFLGSYDLLG